MSSINELKTLIRINTSNFFKLLSDLEKQKRSWIQKALKLKRRAEYSRLRAAYLALYLVHKRPQGTRIWTLERKGQFWEDEVPKFDDNRFKQDFRVDRETFDWLVHKLYCLERKNTSLRKAISLRKRIAIALYALGCSNEYKKIGNVFGIGRTTTGEIVRDFCKALYHTLKDEYLNAYPVTREKLSEVVQGFGELGFPQCFGALDERLIELRARNDGSTDYYDLNGKYSIIMLSVIDHKSKFSYINFAAPGKNKDSLFFEQSNLKSYHEKSLLFKECSKTICNLTVPVFLIADSPFELSDTVLTPYEENSEYEENERPLKEKVFNRRLLKCKSVADDAFKKLNIRWKRLCTPYGMELGVENAILVIKACCLLHNICIERKDDICDTWSLDIGECEKYLPIVESGSGETDEFGKAIRNSVAEYFLTQQPLDEEEVNKNEDTTIYKDEIDEQVQKEDKMDEQTLNEDTIEGQIIEGKNKEIKEEKNEEIMET